VTEKPESIAGSSPLRIVFMGTPQFAVPSLQALLDPTFSVLGKVVGIVSQPDRPKGRGGRLTAPPIKVLAESVGIPVAQPAKMKDPAFLDILTAWAPDLIAVTAFGRILPPVILNLPPQGCINVHGSLLPKYRGAAPIQWAVINGETETGITTMVMDAGMDTGAVLLQEKLAILPAETAGELAARLAPVGGRLLVETIAKLRRGSLTPLQQEDAKATMAPLLKKEDGALDWQHDARAIVNRIRGLTPWPGAYTFYERERWQIWRAEPASTDGAESVPGTILDAGQDGIRIAAASGSVIIQELQPASGKRLTVKQYLAGHDIKAGRRLAAQEGDGL
jgi:methionyl-tRNA formyltransferase